MNQKLNPMTWIKAGQRFFSKSLLEEERQTILMAVGTVFPNLPQAVADKAAEAETLMKDGQHEADEAEKAHLAAKAKMKAAQTITDHCDLLTVKK